MQNSSTQRRDHSFGASQVIPRATARNNVSPPAVDGFCPPVSTPWLPVGPLFYILSSPRLARQVGRPGRNTACKCIRSIPSIIIIIISVIPHTPYICILCTPNILRTLRKWNWRSEPAIVLLPASKDKARVPRLQPLGLYEEASRKRVDNSARYDESRTKMANENLCHSQARVQKTRRHPVPRFSTSLRPRPRPLHQALRLILITSQPFPVLISRRPSVL
ncbi:uncharacterized protein CIMG_12819 [Coccidioides immitis RS]|uniref:Uncharacterized protein n=1 Tax=Coccidioides immitis (strain RS) TaxID=246410 RepID=A0A0D8JT00_COCIM|nr:uncharacterized protein CIMG_12819 [Coccidioides immitis RS]KJF60244.1 hypothetical protein CIMG_12819 [Coccidioides immitis RS]